MTQLNGYSFLALSQRQQMVEEVPSWPFREISEERVLISVVY